nr:hypothetical protein CFP56_36302 [Quercus suber]
MDRALDDIITERDDRPVNHSRPSNCFHYIPITNSHNSREVLRGDLILAGSQCRDRRAENAKSTHEMALRRCAHDPDHIPLEKDDKANSFARCRSSPQPFVFYLSTIRTIDDVSRPARRATRSPGYQDWTPD